MGIPGTHGSCCAAPRSRATMDETSPALIPSAAPSPPHDIVAIPGGNALVGTARPVLRADGEGPLRRRRLRPFSMMRDPVTVSGFGRFVSTTGYVSDAERIGWSFVFHHAVPPETGPTQAVAGAEWWRRVDGASWRRPAGSRGAESSADHPVTQVSWADASAYAVWAGGRLPTEAQWEHAARGGLGDVPFPWGDRAPDERDFQPCNIWQGAFPHRDTGADGWTGPAPSGSFAPNGYGLHNMVGNVWEWMADPFQVRSLSKAARAAHGDTKGQKLLKGGSYLCHESYCFRYRIAARSGNTPDSTSGHTGFRIVFDAP